MVESKFSHPQNMFSIYRSSNDFDTTDALIVLDTQAFIAIFKQIFGAPVTQKKSKTTSTGEPASSCSPRRVHQSTSTANHSWVFFTGIKNEYIKI